MTRIVFLGPLFIFGINSLMFCSYFFPGIWKHNGKGRLGRGRDGLEGWKDIAPIDCHFGVFSEKRSVC